MITLPAWLRLPRLRKVPTAMLEIRVGGTDFRRLIAHLATTTHGEEAAFLLCGYSRFGATEVLLVRDWIAVPESAKVRDGRSAMAWSADFSAEVLSKADRAGASAVLVHLHPGSTRPRPSDCDERTARTLLPGFSRVLADLPCGAVVLGDGAASGTFWRNGARIGDLSQLRVVDAPIAFLKPDAKQAEPAPARRRNARMIRAIGPRAEARLRATSVAVIGLCGGGSHVCQQLAHMGFGRIVLIDDDVVDETNLGRMVGSRPGDVGKKLKTDVMARLIRSIDPSVTVDRVPKRFPSIETTDAIKTVDLVIACVDSFHVRDQINAFCRRHYIPLVDIGLGLKTENEALISAYGQLTVAVPSGACLRCGPLLSDEVLEQERRAKPPGYDRNPDADGEPQVISMNGVLASEAVNCALDFVTGYARGKRSTNWWLYDGRAGAMTPCSPPVGRRIECPACAEQGMGDSRLPR